MAGTTKYFDRDLSWLEFNRRVLQEAQDTSVPLFERLRFLAIYSSNLDEFFRVRVADIRSLAIIDKKTINKATGIKPKKLLQAIHDVVSEQLNAYGQTLKEVKNEMRAKGLFLYSNEPFLEEHKPEILYYFKTHVLGFLQPQIIDPDKEIFLNNQDLYLALKLFNITDSKTYFAVLNIPSEKLPRFKKLKSIDGKTYFAYLDDIVRAHLDLIFNDFSIEECISIKLNKDADLHIDDEFSGDLVVKIEQQIQKRNLGTPSRFLFDGTASPELVEFFKKQLNLADTDLVKGGRYHNLHDFWSLPNALGSSCEYPKLPIIKKTELDQYRSIFQAIDERDRMLHFPYQSYDYILQFFNEAASDRAVSRIQVTFYRMAPNSMIGEALISAARNGKQVLVFMELKARFDEANNLLWASKMKAEGIKVIYSIPGLKVHAKVALVTKQTNEGTVNYGFFGTGNLNEKTARIYVDHGLLTSNPLMTDELANVFQYLDTKAAQPPFSYLLVSQFNIMDGFKALIHQEIENKKAGKPAGIIIKLNNIEEPSMIEKLYQASAAGVPIDMIVRSICCLIPNKSFSKNIKIRRIVDRYLEHARIFIFHNNGQPLVYMGSADWMTRNLRRRIEVVFPVLDREISQEIIDIVNLQLQDNEKAVLLSDQLVNIPLERQEKDPAVQAQMATYEYLKAKELPG